MSSDLFSTANEGKQPEQILAILMHYNESLIANIKQIIPTINQLNELHNPPQKLFEETVNCIQIINFTATTLCELGIQMYSACCEIDDVEITLTPTLQVNEEITLAIADINPILQTSVTETISQACFINAHVCQSLTPLPRELNDDNDVISTLHTVFSLLSNLHAAYYICYLMLTGQSATTKLTTPSLALPMVVAK